MVPLQALFHLESLQVLLMIFRTKFKWLSGSFQGMINSWDGEEEETLDRGQTVERPKKSVERPKKSMERPKMSMDRVPHKCLTLGSKFRSLVLWRDAWFWLSWYFLIQILQQIDRSSVRNLKQAS